MAIRRLNYTGRKKIRREDVSISLHEKPNAPATFDADLAKLAEHKLPADAAVQLLDGWIAWASAVAWRHSSSSQRSSRLSARRDRRSDRARPVQRPRRGDQHPDPDDHSPRIWLS